MDYSYPWLLARRSAAGELYIMGFGFSDGSTFGRERGDGSTLNANPQDLLGHGAVVPGLAVPKQGAEVWGFGSLFGSSAPCCRKAYRLMLSQNACVVSIPTHDGEEPDAED